MITIVRAKTALVGTAVNANNTFPVNTFSKGRFTRHNFVACDKLTTSLRHESFRVNQTYNLLTIVAYDTKNVVGF